MAYLSSTACGDGATTPRPRAVQCVPVRDAPGGSAHGARAPALVSRPGAVARGRSGGARVRGAPRMGRGALRARPVRAQCLRPRVAGAFRAVAAAHARPMADPETRAGRVASKNVDFDAVDDTGHALHIYNERAEPPRMARARRRAVGRGADHRARPTTRRSGDGSAACAAVWTCRWQTVCRSSTSRSPTRRSSPPASSRAMGNSRRHRRRRRRLCSCRGAGPPASFAGQFGAFARFDDRTSAGHRRAAVLDRAGLRCLRSRRHRPIGPLTTATRSTRSTGPLRSANGVPCTRRFCWSWWTASMRCDSIHAPRECAWLCFRRGARGRTRGVCTLSLSS